ncbi:MBL fold metallo-hydrolase [Fusibacter paucivorans]|uniref:MBL fold metallo-hydrolase n=1 Tax=Fusibacter paucivorans TaxID=76009 RepID=A0ABS5PMR6_9FIRM|nr:MBL fold metallo-hydrolase [Fusibacter paucivorans]MBS7526469.1 MBL fold metallo-hydrolase [Fusibacter paucivorans]
MHLISLTPKTALLVMKYANAGLYYLSDHEVILIDTGHVRESRQLLAWLTEQALTVRYIVNTHGHIDHVGGNYLLQAHFGCEIAMPYIDHLYCEDSSRYYMSFVTTAIDGLMVYGEERFRVDTMLNGQETLEILGHTFRLMTMPGHTPNHHVVITPDHVCFIGDVLLDDTRLATAKVGVVTQLEKHFESIEAVRNIRGCFFAVGHGAHVYLPEELSGLCDRNRAFFQRQYREVLKFLSPESTFDALMRTIGIQYGLGKNVFKYYVAERSIKAYLAYLESIAAIRIHVVDGVLTYTVQLPAANPKHHGILRA